jgi:hypothetical protein
MRTGLRWAAYALFMATSLFGRPALAEYSKSEWPLALVDRPLTNAAGMIELRGDTFRLNLSKSSVGEPISLAPDVYYGLNNLLTIGITHQTGICITGEDKGCAKPYNDVGIDALYALMRVGSFQVAARGGLQMPQFSPDFAAGLNLGIASRLTVGKVAVRVEPTLYLGAIGRGDGFKEFLSLPTQLQFQANPQTAVFLSTGIFGPLSGFGDAYQVPVGLGTLFAINNRIDIGAEIRFLNLLGNQFDGVGRADLREAIARFALRI